MKTTNDIARISRPTVSTTPTRTKLFIPAFWRRVHSLFGLLLVRESSAESP
jgi:hypothetical protein